MYLHTLSTGSVGNCYILNASSGERLIIELGVNVKEIKKALNFDLNRVEGCLLSHAHLDHSKSFDEAEKSGIEIIDWNSQGFGEFKKFKWATFDLFHDVPCNGYLINHEESGTILFATDTFMIKQQFNFPINHFIIEANYCEEILNEKERLGIGNTYVSDRVRRSHLSIQNCIKFLKRHDLSECRNIILIHLSDSNSDEKRFVEMVKKEFPFVEVTAARKDQIVNINKNPF
jgi:phosphoribosyl 1,2-cyclic phosphodiesterase